MTQQEIDRILANEQSYIAMRGSRNFRQKGFRPQLTEQSSNNVSFLVQWLILRITILFLHLFPGVGGGVGSNRLFL